MAFSAEARRDTPTENPVGGDFLAAEATDEAIVAPAPADGAEDDGLAFLVRDLEGELRLEDGAGVVFEAAHDGGIDHDLIRSYDSPAAYPDEFA